MSLLIPGVGMPDICNLCPCTQRPEGCTRYLGAYCGVDGEPITDLGGRRDDCPLIEIPHHGRLIDADALTKQVEKWLPLDPSKREEKNIPFETDVCVSMLMEIEEAPTIIEADYPPSIPLEQVWAEVFGEDGE